jgi:NitT/TauT family transport system substrate-binding protein
MVARMIRLLAALALIAAALLPTAAQEHVSVAAQRLAENGALFLADAHGFFRAEGLDVEMVAYPSETAVAQAVASGATDFGLACYSPAAFDYAARGFIRFVAAQVEEQKGFEGHEIVASNLAWARGLRRIEDLAGKTIAIRQLGSAAHYQLGQIAQLKHFDLDKLGLKPLQSFEAVASAVAREQVQAAVLPVSYAHELMIENQAKLIGWYSEVGTQQLGALFVSGSTLKAKRATVEKFLRAYRRGAAEYASMVQLDRQKKRVSTVETREVATVIARYAFPGRPLGRAAGTVEAGAFPMNPQARLDVADLARQVAWYKAQKLISVDAESTAMVDESLLAGE